MTEFAHISRIDPAELEIVRAFTSEVPVRVGALARELGLEVVQATLPLNISGMIQPRGDSYIIKVNRFESKERQRFTIAHEIAHYLIHRPRILQGVTDSVLYRSRLSSTLEAEANRLAADIIMPRSLVREAAQTSVSGGDDRIFDLAELFGVSSAAMKIRVS